MPANYTKQGAWNNEQTILLPILNSTRIVSHLFNISQLWLTDMYCCQATVKFSLITLRLLNLSSKNYYGPQLEVDRSQIINGIFAQVWKKYIHWAQGPIWWSFPQFPNIQLKRTYLVVSKAPTLVQFFGLRNKSYQSGKGQWGASEIAQAR